MLTYRLNPLVRRWLDAEPPEQDGEPGPEPDWDVWLLGKLARGRMVTVGGVLVDQDVVEQRFACVPERCAPGPARGRWRSCCADAEVSLSSAELLRLRRVERPLAAYLRDEGGCETWTCGGHSLSRPGGRCAFGRLDPRGRIRCRLRAFARARGLEQSQVQPLSCRLFPLILVRAGEGRPVLTMVSKGTRKLVGTWPPDRYPCLSDPSLPPLVKSMKADLDWVFGKGFARELARLTP